MLIYVVHWFFLLNYNNCRLCICGQPTARTALPHLCHSRLQTGMSTLLFRNSNFRIYNGNLSIVITHGLMIRLVAANLRGGCSKKKKKMFLPMFGVLPPGARIKWLYWQGLRNDCYIHSIWQYSESELLFFFSCGLASSSHVRCVHTALASWPKLSNL